MGIPRAHWHGVVPAVSPNCHLSQRTLRAATVLSCRSRYTGRSNWQGQRRFANSQRPSQANSCGALLIKQAPGFLSGGAAESISAGWSEPTLSRQRAQEKAACSEEQLLMWRSRYA